MATAPHTPAFVQPATHDLIRIVPLYVPGGTVAPLAGVAAPPGPQLTFRGGPLITAVEVFTFFWGSAWQTTQAALAGTVNQFFDFILTSPLHDQLGEYSVPGQVIGHGKHTGTMTVPTAHMPHSVSDNAVRHFVQQELASNPGVPQPSKNTLYFVFLPPAWLWSRAAGARARPSAATTTRSTARSSMPPCPSQAVRAAPAGSPCPTR